MHLLATRALILVTAVALSVTLPVVLAAGHPASSSPAPAAAQVLGTSVERNGPEPAAAPAAAAAESVPQRNLDPSDDGVEILDALVVERAVPDDVIPALPDEPIGFATTPAGNNPTR